jgi:pre-mRNA-processing factor 6
MSVRPPRRKSPFGAAPAGYVPGLGRGAAGFTTRSDIGNMAAAAPEEGGGGEVGGSRSAEARAAKLAASTEPQHKKKFGQAPKGYTAGAGGGMGASGIDGDKNRPAAAAVEGQFDDHEDDEADLIWQAIDDRMNAKRNKRNRPHQGAEPPTARAKIGAQFRELKEQLATVSEEDWLKVPEVGDYSLKFKRQQQRRRQDDTFTPLTDSLIESRSKQNLEQTKAGAATTATDGTATTTQNIRGLGAARGTVLGMSLDKMSDSVSGQTVVDPQGYLTSLSNTQIASSAQVGDINKARLLLKSVRDTNPKHGPGWIASARVEEAANKINKARKLIQEGCGICADQEDVWLEAARLHPSAVAKSILATAVRRIPNSVKLFLRAADLEDSQDAKRAVLRKALEANPTSITLWKHAIELEEADDAKVLLSVAVERVPQAVDLWLALARLETYDNARKVLNKARRVLPSDRSIWIAAAKLEESQHHVDLVDKIMDRAFKSLSKYSDDVLVTRAQWLTEAEQAEAAGAPLTSVAIVRHSIGHGVEEEDQQRTWAEDANGALLRGSISTARAILAHALQAFPSKRSLWMQAVELEKDQGAAESLDDILKAASERLPRVELFWLLRAKERWLAKDVDVARDILTKAFAANPDSEQVWLAAAKLEWETGEIERARVLLQRATERAPSPRVYMKSALLEREEDNWQEALALIHQGVKEYPEFAKLYMMGGQICANDLTPRNHTNLEKARRWFQKGLTKCPNNVVLWMLASRLEERAHTYTAKENSNISTSSAKVGVTKARSLLELARLKNPKTEQLWLEAVRLESRSNNAKLAETLMARALQECPNSGLLLAETILTASRVDKKSKSATAIKRCPESPLVICAVASLFASERKADKARKWLERAVILDPDQGDSWARYYQFELQFVSKERQQSIKERCVKAEPKHGELWQSVRKDVKNKRIGVDKALELTVEMLKEQQTKDSKS